MRHTIDSVAFVPGTNDGPMQCSCAWTGLASEFRAHRLADGQSVGKSGAGVHRVSASVWNRHSSMCKAGHRQTRENTYTSPEGNRQCRLCRREAHKRYEGRMSDQRVVA